jgi:hypothetical protein
MSIKTTLMVMMAASLALNIAACKKNDANENAAPDNSGNTIGTPTPTPAAPAAGEVASYPTQVNMGSTTRQTLQAFTVKQAADNTSATIGRVSVGTWINIKASYSNWFLIEFPTGVGQLSPGWIELRGGVSDPRLNQNTTPTPQVVDAGTPPKVVDAGTPPPVVDAGTPPPVVDAGVRRPGIIIKPRK